jgi:MFS family permease
VLATIYIEDVRAENPDPFDAKGALLAGTGIAGLVFGGSVLGLNFLPPAVTIALIVIGALTTFAYVLHARRTPAPILDLKLLKLPTLRAAVVGGFIYRGGIGAMPFLLPLLLQVGFHLTPFKSGLITFTSTMGALFMKAAAPRMLKQFGFRNVLISNAILGGLSIAACAIFRESTPFWIMIAILMLGGFFRSLQFTSVNALAYAEVPRARMSRATALAAVGQQVSLATGVAVGALAVEIVGRMNGQAAIMASDFPPGFLLVGLIAASSAAIFWLLPPNAGAEMANRVPATTSPSDRRMG